MLSPTITFDELCLNGIIKFKTWMLLNVQVLKEAGGRERLGRADVIVRKS